jgi:hypothetical protein
VCSVRKVTEIMYPLLYAVALRLGHKILSHAVFGRDGYQVADAMIVAKV